MKRGEDGDTKHQIHPHTKINHLPAYNPHTFMQTHCTLHPSLTPGHVCVCVCVCVCVMAYTCMFQHLHSIPHELFLLHWYVVYRFQKVIPLQLLRYIKIMNRAVCVHIFRSTVKIQPNWTIHKLHFIGASKYISQSHTEFGGTVELKHVQRLYCSNLENYVWQITHSIVIVDETLTFSTHILQTFSSN